MSEKLAPKVGQVWEPTDSRMDAMARALSRFRIVAIVPFGVQVQNINGRPRPRTILTRRLRPNSTGYRLVSEAP